MAACEGRARAEWWYPWLQPVESSPNPLRAPQGRLSASIAPRRGLNTMPAAASHGLAPRGYSQSPRRGLARTGFWLPSRTTNDMIQRPCG